MIFISRAKFVWLVSFPVNRIVACLLFLLSARAAEPELGMYRWVASVEPSAVSKAARLPLGKPQYFAHEVFVADYQKVWLGMVGVDFLTMHPHRLRWGQSDGTDLAGSGFLTNRAVELFPIPTNQPGLYWRFRADRTNGVILLDIAFTYDYSETNRSGQVVARRTRFHDQLRFASNEVAVLRLPTINYETWSPRRILGINIGEKSKPETREIYLAIGLTNMATVAASP